MSAGINDSDFKILSLFIHKNCGIVLNEDKKYLVNMRLADFLASAGFKDFSSLVVALNNLSSNVKQELINKVTTNETFFFRDTHPFETFKRELLPEVVRVFKERRANPISGLPAKMKCWSLASSTGQEAYSLAMNIDEFCDGALNLKFDDFQIVGTDISREVLERAKKGVYTELEVKRGLSPEQLKKYFDCEDGACQVSSKLKSIVQFDYLNLMDLPSSFSNNFDVIFCRNVLIYFDQDTKEKILDFIYRKLANHGYLILGASESLYGMKHSFKSQRYGQTTVYFK